ncbi:MAG: 1,4-dihydroxy-2-naphthoate polyprenyltransferase [Acidimicrobiales bacterium]
MTLPWRWPPNRWVLGARPRTLPAAAVPVAVGTAAAVGQGPITWWRAGAALVVAVAIQVATNYLNDSADGVRGVDDRRTGPTRLVASGLASARSVQLAAATAAGVAAVGGLALAAAVGPEVVVVGLACFAAGYGYTAGPWPYGYAGLGELFVFVFFGLVATVGSAYVQLDSVDGLAVLVSVPVGFLATALLVVNNLRDIPGDTAAGKRTLAVRMGASPTRALYVTLVGAAFLYVPLVALARPGALLAVLALPAGSRPVRAVAAGTSGVGLVAVLGDTGRLQLVYGLLLAAGLAYSG